MHGAIGSALRIDALGMLLVVAAGIPAADCKIDSPHKSERVVNTDDLLVMAPVYRVLAIEAQRDPWMILPCLP
jgi:hypothetical protein